MGHYTELHLTARLKESTPTEVRDLLIFMFNRDLDDLDPKPRHPFFHTDRCSLVNLAAFDFPVLQIKTDLKNQDDLLEKFLDWISPHVETVESGVWAFDAIDWVEDVTFFEGRFILRPRVRDRYGYHVQEHLRTARTISQFKDLP